MITRMKINNLKSIDEIDVKCTNLNVLTGTNSSGKSTFLQAILLLFQNLDKKKGLNGELVSLGDFRTDVKNVNIMKDSTEINIWDEYNDLQGTLSFCDNDPELVLKQTSQCIPPIDTFKCKEMLHYLSCNRIGAKDIYLKNYSIADVTGNNGEYSLFYLQAHKKDNLEDALCKDNSSITLENQVDYWLKYILNTTIIVEDVPGTDIVKGAFSVNDSRSQRPRNIGSGASYLISIIILCLASKKGDILLIENPEIHLHPKAQSKVCEFLYYIACSNRQLFIETHSDHIFNGIRAGIAKGEIDKNSVNLQFFELDERNCTKNTKIEFGKRGRILNYVEGLFDQFDIDLNKMLDF